MIVKVLIFLFFVMGTVSASFYVLLEKNYFKICQEKKSYFLSECFEKDEEDGPAFDLHAKECQFGFRF